MVARVIGFLSGKGCWCTLVFLIFSWGSSRQKDTSFTRSGVLTLRVVAESESWGQVHMELPEFWGTGALVVVEVPGSLL